MGGDVDLTLLFENINLKVNQFSMKKWSKLVLATMLSAGTLLVSGCIENIEPDGIADLRGAKAELLRAQTALQAAQAAKVEAEAALVLAQAKVQEAIAKQEEARVAYVEAEALAAQYRAEREKLINEGISAENQAALLLLDAQIAAQEAAKADAERAALIAAEQFKIDMLEVTQALAQAQLEYEQALADIEVSRAQLTPKQQAYLQMHVDEVDYLKDEVADLTEDLEDAAEALAEATAELDEPTVNRMMIKRAERSVVNAQALLEAAQEAEAEAQALLELDPVVTDWDAQRESINEQIEALELEVDLKYIEVEERNIERTDSMDLLETAAMEYAAYTGFAFDQTTGRFSKIPASPSTYIDVPEVYIAAPLDEDGNAIFDFNAFVLSGNTYAYGYEDVVAENLFDSRLLALSAYNTDAQQEQIDNLNEIIGLTKESVDYKQAMTRYEDAVAAYNAGDYFPYFDKYNYALNSVDLKELVAEYNEALEAFNAEIKEYDAIIAKHDVDQSEELQALQNTRDEELDAAELAKYVAYQAALDKKAAAQVTYEKALTAYNNATADYNRKMQVYTSEATVAEMEQYITDYDNYVSLGGNPAEDNDPNYVPATYNKYKQNLASIAALQKSYNDIEDPENDKDAQSVYDKALAAWNEAQTAYSDEKTAADNAYSTAGSKAWDKYDAAVRELQASNPGLDYSYASKLEDDVRAARTAVGTAMANLVNELEDVYRPYEGGVTVDFVAGKETSYEVNMNIWGVPSYLRKDNYDAAANVTTYELIPADLKAIQDADAFLATIKDLADDMLSIEKSYDVYAFDDSWSSYMNVTTSLNYVGDFGDDYPLTLPDYDTFVADYEANFAAQEQRVIFEAYNTLANWGYPNSGWPNEYNGPSGILAGIYDNQTEIAELQADMKNIELIPDFMKAIEAAKAEFLAYAAEKTAEIDALKADVEAHYPALLAEVEAELEEADAYAEKVDALNRTLGYLDDLISKYCDGLIDLDDFVAYLEGEYENAVQATFDAEEDLINAQQTLKDLNDGLVDAVELAQKNFDELTEELAEVQAELDEAVKALEAAIELVYGSEELPETPQPEEPGTGEEETPAA